MKLRTRLSLHFLIQFIILFITTSLFVIGLFLLIANFMTDLELEDNPRKAMVENIPIDIMTFEDDDIYLSDKWVDILKTNHTWMQIINREGEEIFSSNKPDSLQTTYSMNELLKIEETGKHENYTVDTYYETWGPGFYFLFGYVDNEKQLIEKWYETYGKNGIIDETLLPEIEIEMEKHNSRLEVYGDDQLIQEVGLALESHQDKFDVISRIHTPGKQNVSAAIHVDEAHDTTWVYYANVDEQIASNSGIFLDRELQMILIGLGISLAFAIIFSIWSGYRYGKPLLLFMNWFEVIKNKQYGDILSVKEQKRIYRKNGKIKLGYRLYNEVIESFTNMANKLDEAEKERKQLEETREELMVGISHDLRTPISSMHGYGHLLESNQYEFTPDELQEIGKVIREKSDYMVELVEDFSLIFKLKNSTIEIDKTIIDLNLFIHDVIKKFKNDLTLEGYTFKFEPSDTASYAFIDSKWIVRALDNLIYNAVKHNPLNTTVTVRIRNEQNHTMIDVIDNGNGMDQSFLENLFSRYYRGVSTEEKTEGEGLGMSITKAIIDLHGGEIKVKSQKGKGTTITILLT